MAATIAVIAACTTFGSGTPEPDARAPEPDASAPAPDATVSERERERDAAPVLDAEPIDAADAGAFLPSPPDAACRERDAGFAVANCGNGGARGVACGTQVCRDGTPTCCRGDGGTAECKNTCGADAVYLDCDSPDDCAEGQVCCGYAMSAGVRAVCAKDCGGLPAIALCTDASHCRSGSCTTPYAGTGYRYCTP